MSNDNQAARQQVSNNAFVRSLRAQRDSALDACASFEAQIADLQFQLNAATKELETLKATDSKPADGKGSQVSPVKAEIDAAKAEAAKPRKTH